jgi:hypothetical protein
MKKFAAAIHGAIATLAIAVPAPSQNRVFILGTPTNLRVDWSMVISVPDPVIPNSFYSVIPIGPFGSLPGFNVWDGDVTMDLAFGAGNWMRCTMRAEEWAYVTDAACAHVPGPGLPAPMSVLMSSFDWGDFDGSLGIPHYPWPNSTRFPTSILSSVIRGAYGFNTESWQLRTRGFFSSEIWNGCGPSLGVTPTFSGFVVARFSFNFS